jgi:uncharacterized protein YecT (DUF1311 family)
MEIVMLRVAALLCTFTTSVAYACDDRNCDPHSGLALDASCLELVWDDPAVQKAQGGLSDAYELALSQSSQKEALEMAQRAWLDYRHANCEVMSDRHGRPGAQAQAQCLAFMTGERIRELRLLSY